LLGRSITMKATAHTDATVASAASSVSIESVRQPASRSRTNATSGSV